MTHTETAAETQRRAEHDHLIVMQGASWSDFQRMLEIRGERPLPRFAFIEGTLQLMTPSREHELVKSMTGRLVEAWCMVKNLDISPFGAWLLEDEAAERGLEPDECYVLGDVPDPKRPDLAIEVVWTSGSIDKLQIYRGLGVPEVWIWKDFRFSMYAHRDGDYESVDESTVLPGIDLVQLAKFIEIQPMTRAVREYRAALGC